MYHQPNNIENIKKNLGYILSGKGQKQKGKHCTASIISGMQKVELIKQWITTVITTGWDEEMEVKVPNASGREHE
jgi:hypothetical protein